MIYILWRNLIILTWSEFLHPKGGLSLNMKKIVRIHQLLNNTFIWFALKKKKYKEMLTAYNRTTVPIRNTSLEAQHYRDEVTYSRPDLPGGSFLVENSGRPSRVLPMLVLICLVLDPSLPVSPSVGWDLWCGTFWALPSSCSTLPSSVDTWPFSEKPNLWLCLDNPGSTLIGCRCCVHQKILFLG